MTTQTDVQQLIQGLTPTAVNAGNPNTAYNFAPPTTNAQGNWFGAGMPAAANLGALQLTARQPWAPPAPTGGQPGGSFLDLLPTIPEGGIPTNPGWDPTPGPVDPVTPPPVTPPGTTTGGGTGPQGQGWNDGPAQLPGSKPAPGGGGGPGIDRLMVPSMGPTWTHEFQQRGLPVDNLGRVDPSNMDDSKWDSFMDSMGKAMGNIADVILPGDMYDSESGVDMSNMVTGVLDKMLKSMIPFLSFVPDNLVDKLAERAANWDWLPDWIQDPIKKHVEEQKEQKRRKEERRQQQQSGQGSGSGGGGGSVGRPFSAPISMQSRTGRVTVGDAESYDQSR